MRGAPAGSWGKPKTLHESPENYLWVETKDFLRWDLVLGKSSRPAGLYTHWVVQLDVEPDKESATIATLSCATRDDDMIDSDAHDALRTEILRALGTAQTAQDDEAEMTRLSLTQKQPFTEPAPGAVEFEFGFDTKLDASAIAAQLSKLGLPPRMGDAGRSITWPLGTISQNDHDHVHVVFADGNVRGAARISSAEPSRRRLAHADLAGAITRLTFLIQQKDESASYAGPTGWLQE